MMTEMMKDAAGPGRGGRMSRQRKREAVLRLLRGEDLDTVSRSLGVTAATLSDWRDAAGARTAGGQDRRAGERPPFSPEEVEAMSRALSPSSGQPYGLARVCRIWRVARASVYRHRNRSRTGSAAARPDRCPIQGSPPRSVRSWRPVRSMARVIGKSGPVCV